jgi:hypothetical protein
MRRVNIPPEFSQRRSPEGTWSIENSSIRNQFEAA